jgi:hypothetical protein
MTTALLVGTTKANRGTASSANPNPTARCRAAAAKIMPATAATVPIVITGRNLLGIAAYLVARRSAAVNEPLRTGQSVNQSEAQFAVATNAQRHSGDVLSLALREAR